MYIKKQIRIMTKILIDPSHKSRESSQINKKCKWFFITSWILVLFWNSFAASNDYVSSSICRIIPRNCWFALEPLNEYEYIKEPIDIVIICKFQCFLICGLFFECLVNNYIYFIAHSATDSSISSTKNMDIIRNIQVYIFNLDS